jgi:hypothetical protein
MSYQYYNDYGCNYLDIFLGRNPEFNIPEFINFVVEHNKGDRDSGELADIAKHEVLRLAAEYAEYRHRFPNCFSEEEIKAFNKGEKCNES